MNSRKWIWMVLGILCCSTKGFAEPVKIGATAVLPDLERSHFNRYVNWRPADGEIVQVNPPRISWPYSPVWPQQTPDTLHTFTLQIASDSAFKNSIVDVTTEINFYNAIPALKGAKKWYWRVGYDMNTDQGKWSAIRSFTLSDDVVLWDRSAMAKPDFATLGHPRILFTKDNVDDIRALAKNNADSRAALDWMKARADEIMQKDWWVNFPKTDREEEPKEEFYQIAGDLTLVCFVWRMTQDDRYAGVKERALIWAGYPPGGRASPEGLGGDGSEDATQGSEFLALLFDWLYEDLNATEREAMIHSLTWRTDHMVNRFSWKRNGKVRSTSLSGRCSSHQFEGSMDAAVCGLVLYEHHAVGKEWYDLMSNYLVGVTCGFGFDEAWNEGPGYGSSKAKWLANASLYYDTSLPKVDLGRNPFYDRITDYFSRVIPVGMDHNAWGNQRNASRGNHLRHFRKFAYLTGDGKDLLNWHEYGGESFSDFRPWIEYVLPYYYEKPMPKPEEERVALFAVDGWGMAATGPPSLRSTYENGVGMIFQCRPRGGYGHSFNSDGSFQLHAYGQMLNHGGGSSGNRDAYAYHTMSHNTIMVDGLGQAQSERGMSLPTYGRMVGHAKGDDYVYFAGDASNCYPDEPGNYRRWSLPIDKVYEERALPYLKRFVRHMLFVKGKYFVIFDDLESTQPATYTWLYHILPDDPLGFDASQFAFDYAVGDVKVNMQHIAHPDQLVLDNRKGEDAFVNPMTGEDYREWRRTDILCGHNLWVSNKTPAKTWQFLTVVYPSRSGETPAKIERIDDFTVRVGDDVITFDPKSARAQDADFVVDVSAFRSP